MKCRKRQEKETEKKMDIARYSNFITPDFDPENIKGQSKGSNSIAVMALAYNEPKGQEGLGKKVADVVLEHFVRRPTLKDEGLQKITEFAHDAICVQQSPGYAAECDLAIVMTQGSKFRWINAGGARVYYFLNGQIMEKTEGKTPRLGNGAEKEMPEGIAETEFQKGENSFLLCSESFAAVVSEADMENALASADSAEDWLKALKALYEDRAGEPFALMTVFMPQKRKRLSKKAWIAIIVAAVLVIGAIVFFAMGAGRRRQPGGPGEGPGQPGMEQQGGPGQKPTRPPKGEGMEGEEPTEPPAPGQGPGAEGGPGQKPTKPPKDENAEEGEEPTEPPAPGSDGSAVITADPSETVSPEGAAAETAAP